MNKQEFFNLIVSEAVKAYPNPIVSDQTEVGADFCTVTEDGVLKYISMGEEPMNAVFHKVVSSSEVREYDFRPFLIRKDDSEPVKFVERFSDEYGPEDYMMGGLDLLEVIVDAKDNSKYLIACEGEPIFNTAEIGMSIEEEECIFSYNGTELVVQF